MKLALLMIITAVVTAGCTSPEVSRSRGGGPGADWVIEVQSCACTKAPIPLKKHQKLSVPSIRL